MEPVTPSGRLILAAGLAPIGNFATRKGTHDQKKLVNSIRMKNTHSTKKLALLYIHRLDVSAKLIPIHFHSLLDTHHHRY